MPAQEDTEDLVGELEGGHHEPRLAVAVSIRGFGEALEQGGRFEDRVLLDGLSPGAIPRNRLTLCNGCSARSHSHRQHHSQCGSHRKPPEAKGSASACTLFRDGGATVTSSPPRLVVTVISAV